MTQIAYGNSFQRKQLTCVEVTQAMTQTAIIALGAQSVQITYTNALNQTLVATVTVSAPNAIFVLGGGFRIQSNPGHVGPIPIIISFDTDYSGEATFTIDDLENDGPYGGPDGYDRLCGFNIGLPNNISNNSLFENGCVTSSVGDTATKVAQWLNIIDQENITFDYVRSIPKGFVTITLDLTKRKIESWLYDGSEFTDPSTNLNYTTIPAGVELSKCEDENKYISWNSELCSKVPPLVYQPQGPTTFNTVDVYNGLNPRTDGSIGILNMTGGYSAMEFSADGITLHAITAATNIFRYRYNPINGLLTTLAGFPLNNSFMPVAVGAPNYRGLAVDSSSEQDVLYMVHRQIGPNIIHLVKLNPYTGIVTYIGSTGISWVPTALSDQYDLTFTESGNLLYSHDQTIYVIDKNDGQVLSQMVLTVNNGATAWNTGWMSRMANGDILVSGRDNLNFRAWVLDAETLAIKHEWSTVSSLWFPSGDILLANPKSYNISFQRVFRQDLDTGDISFIDYDKLGKRLELPSDAVLGDCVTEEKNSWFKDLCYREDNFPASLGDIAILQAGGAYSPIGSCESFAAFTPPGGTFVSTTHTRDSNSLIGLNAAGNLVTHPWTTKTTPGAGVGLVLAGIPVTETKVAIRTRWSDDSLWIHTQDTVTPTIHRFYQINKTTGACTLQGTLTLTGPNPIDVDGTFTWGIDDKMYFTTRYSNTGGGIFAIYVLNIFTSTYSIQSTLAYFASNKGARLTTDVTTGLLIAIAQGNNRVEYYNTNGDKVRTCNISSPITDFIKTPEVGYSIGTSYASITRAYTQNTVTGKITFVDLDPTTGKNISIKPGTVYVSCRNAKTTLPLAKARVQQVSGINTWSKAINAPNATSITFTRVASTINVNDGISPAFVLNAAATFTWANAQINNNITFAGTAAGSIFIVNWLE